METGDWTGAAEKITRVASIEKFFGKLQTNRSFQLYWFIYLEQTLRALKASGNGTSRKVMNDLFNFNSLTRSLSHDLTVTNLRAGKQKRSLIHFSKQMTVSIIKNASSFFRLRLRHKPGNIGERWLKSSSGKWK